MFTEWSKDEIGEITPPKGKRKVSKLSRLREEEASTGEDYGKDPVYKRTADGKLFVTFSDGETYRLE